jgi:hypothetical protein
MKKIIMICASSFILLSSCLHQKHNVSVTATEDESRYAFNATYAPNKTIQVHRYIQSQLQPTTIFENMNSDVDITAVLQDDTKLYIQSNKGMLHIKLNKDENSSAAYYKIKKMCDGIKDIIAH